MKQMILDREKKTNKKQIQLRKQFNAHLREQQQKKIVKIR